MNRNFSSPPPSPIYLHDMGREKFTCLPIGSGEVKNAVPAEIRTWHLPNPSLALALRHPAWFKLLKVNDRCRWGRDFPPVQTGPGAHPASCKMGTGSFPEVNCGRGMLLTTHPLLVPRSWKSRAIALPTLWATPGL